LLFTSFIDDVINRCVKVIVAKGKDGSLEKLTSSEFLQLAKSIKRYMDELEKVVTTCCGQQGTRCLINVSRFHDDDVTEASSDRCGRLTDQLQGALRTQAGKFVNRFHDERKTKLSMILDSELWRQADVPQELFDLIRGLVEGKKDWDSLKISGCSDVKYDLMIINDEKFAVAGTVLILLQLVTNYCKCCSDYPASCSDLIHRLCDLLTTFNSKTCQLVLGAGAIEVARLKTITTKNLALASRSLQLVLTCLPAIRAHFHNYLRHPMTSSVDVLRQFENVTKVYQEHVSEIHNKLVTIVGSVLAKQLNNWQVKAPVPSSAFRSICRQLSKFHETIVTLLPPDQVRALFIALNDRFRQLVSTTLIACDVINDGGPRHGLVTSDLNFYEKTVTMLEGLENLDLQLASIWRRK